MNNIKNDLVSKNEKNNALEKFEGATAFLKIGDKTFAGTDPYLMIKKSSGQGYYVNGVIGFGGMGYRGYVSTQKVMKILKNVGFDINARQLNNWIRG